MPWLYETQELCLKAARARLDTTPVKKQHRARPKRCHSEPQQTSEQAHLSAILVALTSVTMAAHLLRLLHMRQLLKPAGFSRYAAPYRIRRDFNLSSRCTWAFVMTNFRQAPKSGGVCSAKDYLTISAPATDSCVQKHNTCTLHCLPCFILLLAGCVQREQRLPQPAA